MGSFKKIDNVIRRHLKELRKPNVLTVKPGYKFTGGWITNKLAIVAIVDGKTDKVPAKSQVPPTAFSLRCSSNKGESFHIRRR